MANIKFSKKQFEKDFGSLDEKMQNRIAMFGTTLENFNEDEIELEIFPNRPDLLSYQGFKRGFSSYLGKEKGLKKYKINKPEKNYKVIIDNSVKNVRPFTVCSIIKKISLDDEKIKELVEIQEKLHNTLGRKRKKVAIGIYPLEKIKLPITYKALEPDKINFIPLESTRKMSGLEILQKHPKGKEYAHLLAGKIKFPIFIDDNKNILSMPPVINSELTVECSGSNLEILKKTLNIIVTCLSDMGGEIYQMNLISENNNEKKETTPNLNPEKMKISLKNTNKLLGLNLNEKQIKELIEKMGHEYKKPFTILTPAWRTDILHEVDLIEDIAIAYGYENFIPEIPEISTIGEENFKEPIKRKISEILTGLKFIEILNYHLTNKNYQFKKMGISEKKEMLKKDFIEIEESKTDYNILRKNLSHYILKVISENIDSEYPQKIFEIGKIFQLDNKKIIEKENISIAITPGNFTEIKQTLEYLFRMIEIKIKLSEPDKKEIPSHFIDGRTATINLNEKEIGFIGEISPKILKNWKIKMPVALLEISLEEIFELLK